MVAPITYTPTDHCVPDCTTPEDALPTPSEDELLRAAFRDLHGTRLHGFALLVTLGDRRRAASVTRQALIEATRGVQELRHPERAAAWLRAHVLRSLRRFSWPSRQRLTEADRLAALRPMGVDASVLSALAALSIRDRAVLVTSSIERLEAGDVQTVLTASPSVTQRAAMRVRRRYLEARASMIVPGQVRSGPTTERVLQVAARAFPLGSPGDGPR